MKWMEEAGMPVEFIYSPQPPSTVLIGRPRDARPSKAMSIRSPELKDFKNDFWDNGPRSDVKADLLTRMKAQIEVARTKVDFWKNRLPAQIQDIEALALLHKSQIKNLSPLDLVPDQRTKNSEVNAYTIFRGTGGTTGKPLGSFWSQSDWNASIEAATRYLEPLRSLDPLIVWNGYNQAHVSGPAFDDIIRKMGGTPIARHFRSSDLEAIQEIQAIKANALVVTPKGGSGKGGSLEDLLIADPDFLKRLGIRALLVSSTPLEKEMVNELQSQGVDQIYNFYGSTEAFPTAVSCQADPTTFHLCLGHLYVEVVNADGRHVLSGERGLIVVSRIGSSSPNGLAPNQGTQLFRYVVGDTAIFVDEPCSCGRATPRIHGITRVINVEDKLKGGCERWE
jgi:phenylacetate-coenzyme A ligase PaaK-like adenylate-forming protein